MDITIQRPVLTIRDHGGAKMAAGVETLGGVLHRRLGAWAVRSLAQPWNATRRAVDRASAATASSRYQ